MLIPQELQLSRIGSAGLFEFYPFYFFFIPTGCGNEKYISGDFVFSHQNLCFILKVAILCLLLYL